MSPIVMNILAYLAIIALLGLIAIGGWAAVTVMAMIRRVKSVVPMINAPRQSAIQIVSVVKGIGLKSTQRFKTMAANGKAAAASATAVKDDLVDAFNKVDFSGVTAEARETVDNVRYTGDNAASFMQQVMQTIQQVKASCGRSA